jgi:hypothetical protein
MSPRNMQWWLCSFFNLRARWRWVVNATPRPLYPRERPGIHCPGGRVGPQGRSERVRKITPPAGLDPRTVHSASRESCFWLNGMYKYVINLQDSTNVFYHRLWLISILSMSLVICICHWWSGKACDDNAVNNQIWYQSELKSLVSKYDSCCTMIWTFDQYKNLPLAVVYVNKAENMTAMKGNRR